MTLVVGHAWGGEGGIKDSKLLYTEFSIFCIGANCPGFGGSVLCSVRKLLFTEMKFFCPGNFSLEVGTYAGAVESTSLTDP